MEVIIKNLSPNDAIDIVRDVREQGLVQGKDFDFAFYQTRWDSIVGEIPKYTKFIFHQDKWAVWFSLKYGDA